MPTRFTNRLRAFALWIALAGGLLGSAAAADLPDLVLPQGVGVNVHFTRGHQRDLDLIAAAGFKFIRMDFTWGGIERVRGEYNWADYEELTANLEQRGLRAIYILDYSNGLYERDGSAPQHPESVAAFARWAGAAAAHFRGRRILWEIWNEPNISFWKPKPDVKQYIALAQATCKAIRENDPAATIIAPASSEFPWRFLEEMFQAGLLEQLDAVSVHPYRDRRRPPETAADDYLRLRALIERYASPARKGLPIISGEWGYSTHKQGVSLETQAAFIVRQQLANLSQGIPLSIWYDWKNDGPDPAENEHNFGTVYPDLRPKPAYTALQVMTRELAGCRIARRLPTTAGYVLLLVNPAGDQKLAAWSADGELEVSVDLGLDSPADVAICAGDGQPQAPDLQRSVLRLRLGPLPQYVTLKKRSPALAAAAAWKFTRPWRHSVEAGVKNGLTIPLSVANPFSHPVTAVAKMTGDNLTARKSVRLAPGKTAELALAGTLLRRDHPEVPVTLGFEMLDPRGKVIGSCAETVRLALINPLRLDLAPVEKGFRVRLASESGGSFAGSLVAGAQKHPVSLAAGRKETTVDLSGAPGNSESGLPACGLLDKRGELIAETTLSAYSPLAVSKYVSQLDGDAKVPGTASIQEVAAPGPDAPYARAWALDYRFDEGWRFVRCDAEGTLPLGSKPAALGVWIYGDNSGNSVRIRVRDASGQTFQPAGLSLDWTGWRWVKFDLQDLAHAGHWGGANDGVVHGDLTLETPLLVDSTRAKTAGRIYFAGPVVFR